MPLRDRHPGLFRALIGYGVRDFLWGLSMWLSTPRILVPGHFPSWTVGGAWMAVGAAEIAAAWRTHSRDSPLRTFWIEKAPLAISAGMWAMSAVWSWWSWSHDLGARTIAGAVLYTSMAYAALNAKAEPTSRADALR